MDSIEERTLIVKSMKTKSLGCVTMGMFQWWCGGRTKGMEWENNEERELKF